MRTQRIDESLVTKELASTALTSFGLVFVGACILSVAVNYFGNPDHASPIASVSLFDESPSRRPVYLAEANSYNAAPQTTTRRLRPAHPTDALLEGSIGGLLAEPTKTTQTRPAPKASRIVVKTVKPTVYRTNEDKASTETIENDTQKVEDESNNKKIITIAKKEDIGPTIRVNGKAVPVGLPKLDAMETMGEFAQNPVLGVAHIEQQKIALHNQARAFTPRAGIPKVSIIIGGLGLKSDLTRQAINDLPADVSLAFIPHAYNLSYHINQARKDGHEVLIEMPMQPLDYGRFKPHPQVLTVDNSPQENIVRLQTILNNAPGIFGIMNYQGGKFALDVNAVRPITEALKQFNIALIDDGSIPGSVLGSTSMQTGTLFSGADLQIDLRETSGDIALKLAELEALARKNGHAVGAGYALPLTLDAITRWAEDLDRRGLQLVPISASLKNSQPKKIN